MLDFFICLLMSVAVGCSLAIVLVEKGKDWPIRSWRIRIQFIQHKIYWRLPQMLFCTTCTSFWTTFIADIIIRLIAHFNGVNYFFWPFSGFMTCGLTWFIIEILNNLDKDQNTNIFIDKEDLK